MSFGKRLKALRTSAGMTQDELASKIGVQKQHISRYENDRCEPNIRTAKKLADALGITLEDLAKGILPLGDDPLSPTERRLVSAWRQADEKDRRIVAATLSDYGFSYNEESSNTSAG